MRPTGKCIFDEENNLLQLMDVSVPGCHLPPKLYMFIAEHAVGLQTFQQIQAHAPATRDTSRLTSSTPLCRARSAASDRSIGTASLHSEGISSRQPASSNTAGNMFHCNRLQLLLAGALIVNKLLMQMSFQIST